VLTDGPSRIRRLFDDPRAAEVAYLQGQGYWPIMHFVVFRADVVDRNPWLPRAMYDAFLRAKERVARYYTDPNWSRLIWGPRYQEEEARLVGDPWTHGLAANRTNIARFMQYAHEQGLISAPMAPERLFHESTLET
jgi:4,5-dihydroxyphthalate decarboxylase